MRRLIAVTWTLCLYAPAYAETVGTTTPTKEQRLTMLHDYAVALGQRFACDHNQEQMVHDVGLYAYALQFDTSSKKDSAATVKAGIQAGMDNVKANKLQCTDATAIVTTREQELRGHQALMHQMIGVVAADSGSAIACGVPEAQAQQLLTKALVYTQLPGDNLKAELSNAIKEGTARVKNKAVDCTRAKTIFKQLDEVIFSSKST